MTVTGETLGERLAHDGDAWVDRTIIAERKKPLEPQGGLVALFGNLAPQGAILKRSAADSNLFEHEGRAVVFSSLEDLAARIDDPNLDVDAERYSGAAKCRPAFRLGDAGGRLSADPEEARDKGVKDMVRVSDARMSGTAFGTIVLHVTPDCRLRRPARPGAQRRPHPPVGQAAPHRSCWSTTRNSSAAPPPPSRDVRGARARLCPALCPGNPRRRSGLRFRVPEAQLTRFPGSMPKDLGRMFTPA